jgi:hypothetical protein
MSFRATLFRRSWLAVLLLVLAALSTAHGQLTNAKGQVISPIAFANQDAITTSFVSAPNLGSDSSSSSSDTGQWLKVEFHYGTTAQVTKDYPFVDSIEFRVWIEARDMFAPHPVDPAQGVAVALTGTVTYVNVSMARDLYGVFYVPPSVLLRYGTKLGTSDFDRKFDIHMEAYVGGVLMDEVNKNKEADPLKWFVPLQVVPNLVYRQDQCAFLVSDPDRYPMIRLPSSP